MSNVGKPDELAIFLQTQLEDLLEMSDEDLLEGTNPDVLKSNHLAMITAAKAEAGRRRMAAAKAGVAIKNAASISTMPHVSLMEARAFLQIAMNDDQYTMAARSLGEMSDDDVMRVYRQLHQLKSKNETPDNGQQ